MDIIDAVEIQGKAILKLYNRQEILKKIIKYQYIACGFNICFLAYILFKIS